MRKEKSTVIGSRTQTGSPLSNVDHMIYDALRDQHSEVFLQYSFFKT